MEPQERTASGSRRRVFVLDDDNDFCQLMSRMIGSLGYQVTATGNIKTVDFAKLTTSDVIFVDLMMPGTDGIQVLDVLARNRVRSSIVPMSGSHRDVLATAEMIARRSGLQVIGILNKPFRSHDVRRILGDERPVQPSEKAPVASEINIEDVLAGLAGKEFDAFLQPIIDLSTGCPTGYEALGRWRSEKFSLVGPERFIAVAARNGVLPRLTRQILDRAVGYAAKLKRRGLIWKVSVNIGAEDLVDRELPERLADLLATHDLPAGSLTVELTESSAVTNEIGMFGVLARLRLKGIELAIDDYGTAYSGLDRISNIPFTSVKLDRRFVTSMMTNQNARMIVESSIALAKRLQMKIVAEGIETEAQLNLLQEMGCELGQGYLLARPMGFEDLVAWLSDQPQREAPTYRKGVLNHGYRNDPAN